MARNYNAMKSNGDMVAPLLDPQGYMARLVGVVFLGTQEQRPYMGQTKPPIEEVRYTYELSDEFMEDADGNVLEDKPRWFSEDMPVYGPQADKAKLTRRNKAIDPAGASGGDPAALLGLPCSVLVVHNPGSGKHAGKVFMNVGDVSPAPKLRNYSQPELINKTFYFDPYDEDCTLEEFRKLPEFLQTKIKGAIDYDKMHLKALIDAAGDAPADEPSSEPQAEDDTNPDNPY